MTIALTEALTVIGEADASLPGSEFGYLPHDINNGFADRYVYLRFKHSDGQPTTYVRVDKNARQN
jgi:hypothetical protein